MATISSSGASGAAPAASSMPPTVASSSTTPGSSPGNTTDVFTQLLALIKGGGAPSSDDLAALTQDLEALDLPVEDTHDGGPDNNDDDDATAVAALLANIASFAPITPPLQPIVAPGQPGNDAAGGAVALNVARAEIDITQGAIDELAGKTQDAGDDSSTTQPDPNAATASTQSTSSAATPTSMHALLNAHAAARVADATPDGTLKSPLGSARWQDDLGNQLTWMANNGREAASLRLTPENLGPVEVRISIPDGQASVFFGAASADTRSALEQSLPRLRELFAAQGMVLTDAGVSRDAPRQAFKPSTQPGGTRGSSDAIADAPVKSVTLSRLGLVDTYV